MTAPQDVPAVVLPGGGRMPQVGFGTWKLRNDQARDGVLAALAAGYRHIDTATMYSNEAAVGAALAASGMDRGDLFVTTKIRPSDAGRARAIIAQSLRALGIEYLDLWLVHWPPSSRNQSRQLWNEVREIQADGLVTDVGVSNYSLPEIDELIRSSGQAPAVNQIDWGPAFYDEPAAGRARRTGHRAGGLQLAEEHQPRRSGTGQDRRRARRQPGTDRAPLAAPARHHGDPEVGAARPDRGELSTCSALP